MKLKFCGSMYGRTILNLFCITKLSRNWFDNKIWISFAMLKFAPQQLLMLLLKCLKHVGSECWSCAKGLYEERTTFFLFEYFPQKPSISSTFFARIFCTKVRSKPDSKLPKRRSYKKFLRKTLIKLTYIFSPLDTFRFRSTFQLF